MISTRSLSKWYGSLPAVDAIDIDVPKGEVVGFLGPNGAGKSTTLRMLAGFLSPTSGSAQVAGFDVVRQSREARRRIGYLPESTPLYPEMRVVEYLRFRSRLFGIPGKERAKAVSAALQRCWLADVERKPIAHLSKGYRQRVGLAAALLHRPPVLLLDEPTSGLDPTQIREMRGLIREIAGEHTVLLSTHILSEVEMTCDGAVIIARGRVCAQGRLDELKSRGAESVTYVVETDAPGAEAVLSRATRGRRIDMRQLDGRWRRCEVRVDAGEADLREPIAQALAAAGGAVRDLHREMPGLEQLFMRLISEEPAPARSTSLHVAGAAA